MLKLYTGPLIRLQQTLILDKELNQLQRAEIKETSQTISSDISEVENFISHLKGKLSKNLSAEEEEKFMIMVEKLGVWKRYIVVEDRFLKYNTIEKRLASEFEIQSNVKHPNLDKTIKMLKERIREADIYTLKHIKDLPRRFPKLSKKQKTRIEEICQKLSTHISNLQKQLQNLYEKYDQCLPEDQWSTDQWTSEDESNESESDLEEKIPSTASALNSQYSTETTLKTDKDEFSDLLPNHIEEQPPKRLSRSSSQENLNVSK